MIITSIENEKIKEIKKLKQKKYRKDKFIVEGIKMVEEAINEKADIDVIVIRSGFDTEFDFDKYNVIETTDKVFSELTDVVSPQGIIAVINKQKNKDTLDINDDYFIVLDGIQDPGNAGTIIRTADAANIKHIIISKDTVDCYSPKVIRSTMGAIYRVKIVEENDIKDKLMELKNKGFEIVTTQLDGRDNIYDINYSRKIVVIGNESNGVRKEIRDISDYKVKIPMLGKTESLNASVAGGIMIFEYVRQKIKK